MYGTGIARKPRTQDEGEIPSLKLYIAAFLNCSAVFSTPLAGGLRFEFKLLKFSLASPGTDTFLSYFAVYGWTEGKGGGGNKSETGRGWMDGWKGSFVAGFFLEVNRLGGSSHGIMYIVLRILASAVRWCRCLREFKTLIFLSTPFSQIAAL